MSYALEMTEPNEHISSVQGFMSSIPTHTHTTKCDHDHTIIIAADIEYIHISIAIAFYMHMTCAIVNSERTPIEHTQRWNGVHTW